VDLLVIAVHMVIKHVLLPLYFFIVCFASVENIEKLDTTLTLERQKSKDEKLCMYSEYLASYARSYHRELASYARSYHREFSVHPDFMYWPV
jgi:hypothetical protein